MLNGFHLFGSTKGKDCLICLCCVILNFSTASSRLFSKTLRHAVGFLASRR